MIYKEITGKIIGCAMQVHKILGNGFQEAIYQRALAIEMEHNNIEFEREKEIIVYYRDTNIGSKRVDFLVENKIVVELKAVARLEEMHLLQVINYLDAFRMEMGLLINFGESSLQFKRAYNNKLNL